MDTEVATNLPGDGGHRKGQKVCTALGFEAVHGMDQTDGGDLNEVLQRFTAASEAAREAFGQWEVTADQLLAQLLAFGIVSSQRGIAALHANKIRVLGGFPAGAGHRCCHRSGEVSAFLIRLMHTRPYCPAAMGRPTAVTSSARHVSTHQPNEPVGSESTAASTSVVICTRSDRTLHVHLSLAFGAAMRTSMAHASSTAIRRSSIESRSKSARAARSAATVRMVGITRELAAVSTSMTAVKLTSSARPVIGGSFPVAPFRR